MMMMLVTKKMNDSGVFNMDYEGNLSHLLHIAQKHNDIIFMAIGENLRKGKAQRSFFFLVGNMQTKEWFAELDRYEFFSLPKFFQKKIIGFINGFTKDIRISR